MEKAPPPPPRREYTPTPKAAEPEANTWSAKMKARGGVWGKKAIDKGTIWSDKIGGRVNDIAEKKFGTEHFWPVTGDMPKEIEKCARILRAFTVEGIVKEETAATTESETGSTTTADDKGKKKKQTVKVLRKIPPKIIQEARGIVIFTAMRSGFAPFGGAGGSGVVLARLEDGSWSAPASISPNNLSTGLLAGLDVYDCVLVLRDPKAVEGFFTHKFTLGAEIGIAAGPYGSGGSVESGKEKAAVFSYIRSKGLYAGIEITGTVFVERFDENGQMYHWNGVKAGDILSGKVRIPPQAAPLHEALYDAESGKAQHLQGNSLDTLLDDDNRPLTAAEASKLDLDEGEILKLPPTPEMTDGTEHLSDPETTKVHLPSAPASGTSTPNSNRRIPPPPPALPPRTGAAGLRPPMDRNDSSASHYSDALDNDKGAVAGSTTAAAPSIAPMQGGSAVPADGPPGYEDFGSAPSTYPAEKSDTDSAAVPGYDHSSVPAGYPVKKGEAPGYDQHPSGLGRGDSSQAYAEPPPAAGLAEGLSEGDRREWEQHYADQALAQQAGQLDLDAPSTGQGAPQHQGESLR